jgi:hypothetical protein
MTDAKEVTPTIQKLREFVEDGNDGTFGTVAMHGSSVIGGHVSALLAEIDTLTRERDAAVQACRLFVEWMDRDDSGSGVTNEERDTAQGKAQWQAWWDGNMELCGKAMDAARAVVATAQGDA